MLGAITPLEGYAAARMLRAVGLPAMQVAVINGVNLSMLGRRDPEQYGTLTLDQLETQIYSWASDLGMGVRCFNTNHEGAFVELVHEACDWADGLIVNPGCIQHLTHEDFSAT